jgi:type VI protein secretion system component VasK
MSSHYIRIQTTLVFWGASPIISDCVRSFVSKRRVCVTVCVTVCVWVWVVCMCMCVGVCWGGTDQKKFADCLLAVSALLALLLYWLCKPNTQYS